MTHGNKLFNFTYLLAKLAYVNLLWILFTLIGLVAFGIFPATVAMFAVVRKMISVDEEAEELPIFRTYWNTYKTEFLKSNLLGLILVAIGFILYIDFKVLPTTNLLFMIIRYILIAVGFVFLTICFYIFPVYVQYNGSLKAYLKHAALFGLSYPLITLTMIIGTLVLYQLLITIPGLLPFLSVSVEAYFLMWLAMHVFKRYEEKRKEFLDSDDKDEKAKAN